MKGDLLILADIRLWAAAAAAFMGSWLVAFTVICGVETGALEYDAGAAADEPLDGLPALGAFLKMFCGYTLKDLKPIAAGLAFIFISRHPILLLSELPEKSALSAIFSGKAGKFFYKLALLGVKVLGDLDIHFYKLIAFPPAIDIRYAFVLEPEDPAALRAGGDFHFYVPFQGGDFHLSAEYRLYQAHLHLGEDIITAPLKEIVRLYFYIHIQITLTAYA